MLKELIWFCFGVYFSFLLFFFFLQKSKRVFLQEKETSGTFNMDYSVFKHLK